MNKKNRIYTDEKQRLESIYTFFKNEQQRREQKVADRQQNLQSGWYEDQYVSLVKRELSAAIRDRNELYKKIKDLKDKPYFAHVQITEKGVENAYHYFLSDSENLDSQENVSEDKKSTIIPFKPISNMGPLIDKIRLLYSAPSENDIEVCVSRDGKQYVTTYTPNLIRDVAISNSVLENVTSLIQEGGEDEYIQADELLAQKLQENRADAQLRNIISTLQSKQYDIIQSDQSLNFVVQGCAGSGKSQCLIHRLFYLRETLSENGWSNVLLITPSQLFRNYSSELMRRYRLTDVSNCSLAEFYCQLLQEYDQRFQNRQYQFELTEEYLPDEYLRRVYAPEYISEIETAIQSAICKHVKESCVLAEIEFNGNEPITIDFVNRVEQQLTDAIMRFDETEKTFADDPEYKEHTDAINELDKQIKALQRRQAELLKNRSKLSEDKEQYDRLLSDLEKAKTEENDWQRDAEKDEKALIDEMVHQAGAAESAANSDDFSLFAKQYAIALYRFRDLVASDGERAKYNRSYLELLHAITEECQEKLNAFLKKETPAAWLRNYEQRYQTNQTNLENVEADIKLSQLYLDDHIAWLQEHNVEDAQKQRQAHRAALERARHYLRSIESSVFEQEVWNVLAPLKKEYNIETLRIEQLDERNQRQTRTRILYKSDLLFYLKIYTALHNTRNLHKYTMICIDEGQDMHAADYRLIRAIYPNATLNIFGDTEQVLHESCGISDWQRETDVGKIYTLNTNYRNSPSIVNFCNTRFGSNMQYCGVIQEDQRPHVIDNPVELSEVFDRGITTVVLKDRESFELLHELAGGFSTKLEYIDTKCDKVPEGKIACYSIYAAKGLEFPKVLVYADGMTKNQKIVACTRAMEELFYFE